MEKQHYFIWFNQAYYWTPRKSLNLDALRCSEMRFQANPDATQSLLASGGWAPFFTPQKGNLKKTVTLASKGIRTPELPGSAPEHYCNTTSLKMSVSVYLYH
jgi:hypothetical protein